MDTNIFLLSRFADQPGSKAARELLGRAAGSRNRVRISRQILREYLAAATRPQPRGAARPMADALADVAWMRQRFEVLEDGEVVTQVLVALCREVPVAGRQIHDANIVATMLAHGESRLATLNAKDFRRYGERIEIVAPD